MLQTEQSGNQVLKSDGNQYFSYIYASDAACALIFLLVKGECGQAYNISDNNCNISLKDLAKNIANLRGTEVVFEIPSEIESKGYSKANIAILNPKKINDLGWIAKNDISTGLLKTYNVLDALFNNIK